ncbi:hypothetical protein [Deinococcus sp. UYEF24]
MRDDTQTGSGQQGHQQADAEAQRHPEGNVPDRIESPDVGLPVDNGQPSGEQNGEEQQEE